jgi:DNA-binding transcriptional ArsR family regulator
MPPQQTSLPGTASEESPDETLDSDTDRADESGASEPELDEAVEESPTGDEEIDRRRFVLEPTRLDILRQILAHPDGVLSVEELKYRNPDDDEQSLRYHIRKMRERDIVEKHNVARSETLDDPPTTFYSVTGEGIRLLRTVNMYDEIAVWRSVYEQMERTERIEQVEALDTRPEVDYEQRV